MKQKISLFYVAIAFSIAGLCTSCSSDDPVWGYADNFGNDRLSEDDNAAAGAMKVYFKISNAVDKNGQPADLTCT